jgi:hypothetical protein
MSGKHLGGEITSAERVPQCILLQMARQLSASEKIRALAAKAGYVPPLNPFDVPVELRNQWVEEFGLSRQAVNYALQKAPGTRKGRPTSASVGRARGKLDTADVVRWLRAVAKGKPATVVAALMSVAAAIETGHVESWTDPNGRELD